MEETALRTLRRVRWCRYCGKPSRDLVLVISAMKLGRPLWVAVYLTREIKQSLQPDTSEVQPHLPKALPKEVIRVADLGMRPAARTDEPSTGGGAVEGHLGPQPEDLELFGAPILRKPVL